MAKRKAKITRPQGYTPPKPLEFEQCIISEAKSLSPSQLKREIERMRVLSSKKYDTTLNYRLVVFKDVYRERLDCGPLVREVLVRSTG